MKEKSAIIFTNDLRLDDNLVLKSAWENWEEVIAFYLFDEQEIFAEECGIRRMWAHRSKFLLESIRCIWERIETLGWKLHIIKHQDNTRIIDICRKYEIEKVFIKKSVWFYEQKSTRILAEDMAENGIILTQVWDNTLVDVDKLPFSLQDMPQVFTHFRKAIEKNCDIQEPQNLDEDIKFWSLKGWDTLELEDFWYNTSDIPHDPRAVLEFRWWEKAAWERLSEYFWETESLSSYKETRNGLIWANYSSKFSPWLALGCISPRQIYNEVKVYEKEIKKNSSTYWLVFELLWRDFFQFIFLQDPQRFWKDFSPNNLSISQTDIRKLEKWRDSKLWVPFVDANMRELKNTWFMSNRWRQNVASYLIHDLKVDWRLWALYFENTLVDYDVASNWWNWAYQAWVGNDPRDNRYFNIEKQQSMYDPDGAYRDLWKN